MFALIGVRVASTVLLSSNTPDGSFRLSCMFVVTLHASTGPLAATVISGPSAMGSDTLHSSSQQITIIRPTRTVDIRNP